MYIYPIMVPLRGFVHVKTDFCLFHSHLLPTALLSRDKALQNYPPVHIVMSVCTFFNSGLGYITILLRFHGWSRFSIMCIRHYLAASTLVCIENFCF